MHGQIIVRFAFASVLFIIVLMMNELLVCKIANTATRILKTFSLKKEMDVEIL